MAMIHCVVCGDTGLEFRHICARCRDIEADEMVALRDELTHYKESKDNWERAANSAMDVLAEAERQRDRLQQIVDEDFDGFMFDGLEPTGDGQLELRTHHERSKLLRLFCAHMIEILDGEGCKNYLETQIVMRPAQVENLTEKPDGGFDFTPGPPGFVLTLRRYDGATPHELRVQAERQRDEAVKLLREWWDWYPGDCPAPNSVCDRTEAYLAGASQPGS